MLPGQQSAELLERDKLLTGPVTISTDPDGMCATKAATIRHPLSTPPRVPLGARDSPQRLRILPSQISASTKVCSAAEAERPALQHATRLRQDRRGCRRKIPCTRAAFERVPPMRFRCPGVPEQSLRRPEGHLRTGCSLPLVSDLSRGDCVQFVSQNASFPTRHAINVDLVSQAS
jgi:hypothetical protein